MEFRQAPEKTRYIKAEIKSLNKIFGRCNKANVLHDIQVIHKYIVREERGREPHTPAKGPLVRVA